MTNLEIVQLRLTNQHIAHQSFKTPEEVVSYMGAMQAQDYAGAKWAVGLRMQKSSDALIEKAMADGRIIRIHVLRPTWHFVTPADARWMIDLTANRIHAYGASRYRQLQLDDSVIKQANDALARALEGGKQLSRNEVMEVLNRSGVKTDELRFILLLMRAELDKVICSGGRQGKQFTYALFDDRVPAAAPLAKDEALNRLARRYFNSRGPATLHDFAWWGGITLTDAKAGLETLKHELLNAVADGHEFWMPERSAQLLGKSSKSYLLPAYDEFAVAYANRAAIVNPKYLEQARHVIFDPSIVVNSQVAGTWTRSLAKNGVEVSPDLFGKISGLQQKRLDAAITRYKKFVS